MRGPVLAVRTARWLFVLALGAVVLWVLPVLFFALALSFGGEIG